MRAASIDARDLANCWGGASCTVRNETCTVSHQISALLKALYPTKTWAVVADFLGLSERAAKYRLSATRPYTVEEIRTLLQSDNGYELLELLMEESKPRWWSLLEQTMALARARHHQELARQQVLTLESAPLEIPARRKAKRIADADRKIAAARSSKETALGFLLADADRPIHRAMAQAKGRR